MKIVNRRALYDYQILEKFEAGIRLTGPEVKSIRGERVSLTGSFVRIMGSEAYLVHALIPLYEYAKVPDYDERRTRKLLLHKRELVSLKTKLAASNLTLVPLSLYTTKDGLIKVEVGLAKGKKEYQKKEVIKQRDLARDMEAQIRGKV